MPEPVLEPALPIVDPHHHLWDRTGLQPQAVRHPFEHVLRLHPRYLFDDLMADLKRGHNVQATVFVECGAMYRAEGAPEMRPLGEVEFVNGAAAMSASGLYGEARACAAIVGHADLMLGDRVAAVLEAQMTAAHRFRGIRHSCAWDADPNVLGPLARRPPGLFREAQFREGFARLAPLGLSFDAWLLEPQLDDLIDLARAFPDTAVVLDHVGTPLGIGAYAGQREARFPCWRDNIRALAQSENVCVKLGGLAMPFAGFDSCLATPPASSEHLAKEWAPYIETCIESFGPQRCMFESNFPVDALTCTYDVLWNAFKHIVAGCSESEKSALFSGTAARFYRID
jgi:predicted TIM-barrel fold metal-dependent hydrolase